MPPKIFWALHQFYDGAASPSSLNLGTMSGFKLTFFCVAVSRETTESKKVTGFKPNRKKALWLLTDCLSVTNLLIYEVCVKIEWLGKFYCPEHTLFCWTFIFWQNSLISCLRLCGWDYNYLGKWNEIYKILDNTS